MLNTRSKPPVAVSENTESLSGSSAGWQERLSGLAQLLIIKGSCIAAAEQCQMLVVVGAPVVGAVVVGTLVVGAVVVGVPVVGVVVVGDAVSAHVCEW